MNINNLDINSILHLDLSNLSGEELLAMAAGFLPMVVLIVLGVTLTYNGFGLFKSLTFIICALVGGAVGLVVRQATGKNEMYIVALVMALIFGILGVRFEKAAVFIAAMVCTQLAVQIFYMKTAMETLRGVMDVVPDSTTFIQAWFMQLKNGGDIAAITREFFANETSVVVDTFEKAFSLVKQGLIVATVAGVAVGALTFVFHDYIIMLFTAVFGGSVLLYILDTFLHLEQRYYALVLLILIGSGFLSQVAKKQRKDKKDSNS